MLNNVVALLDSGVAASTNSFESIATATASGNVTTITFSSIPSTYKHLQIRALHAGYLSGTTGNDLLYVAGINGNVLSYSHRLYGDGSTASAGSDSTNINIGNVYTMPTPTYWTGTIIDILDYSNTNKNKTLRSLSGFDRNGGGIISLSSALYSNNTNAVSSIVLTGGGSYIANGSTFALYGVK